MPASTLLKAFGLLTALAIASAAFFISPAEPSRDAYSSTVRLAAGSLAAAGSLCLARAIGGTFLRSGGRGAFKALYWASLGSAGAGVAGAASVFVNANVPAAAALAALAFTGAGLLLASYAGGG